MSTGDAFGGQEAQAPLNRHITADGTPQH